MKLNLYSICLAVIFLVLSSSGYCTGPVESADSINTEALLKQLDSIRGKLETAAAAAKQKSKYLIYPKITGVGPMSKSRSENLAVFNDYIYLKIDSLPALKALTDSLTGMQKDTMGELILYINGNAMRDLGLVGIDQGKSKLIFQLDRHSKYLMKFYPEFPYLWSRVPFSITAGYRNGLMLPVDRSMSPLQIKYVSSTSIAISLLFVMAIVALFVVLAVKTNLIRIGDDDSPFSLALTQLSFWTIVVASSFIYIWIVTEELPPITGSTLILLSVSALTTAGSRLVDIRTDKKGPVTAKSVSFMEDILRDELGYSVHRAQMFMWTAIMGIVFVSNVIRFQQIPQLDESLLALMGISSTAYVGLKTMENKTPEEEKRAEDKPADL